MTTKSPAELLTVRRIAEFTDQPVSVIRRIIDETPALRPRAYADRREVFDRDALLSIIAILDQREAGEVAQ